MTFLINQEHFETFNYPLLTLVLKYFQDFSRAKFQFTGKIPVWETETLMKKAEYVLGSNWYSEESILPSSTTICKRAIFARHLELSHWLGKADYKQDQ